MALIISDANIFIDMAVGGLTRLMFRINDRLALALAMQEKCPLLTGDASLRQAAEAERVDVKGTVWLMERFWACGLVTYQRVDSAYAAMRNEDRRLPWNEVEIQLRRFRGQ